MRAIYAIGWLSFFHRYIRPDLIIVKIIKTNMRIAIPAPTSIGRSSNLVVWPVIAAQIIRPAIKILKASRIILKDTRLLIRSKRCRTVCSCFIFISSFTDSGHNLLHIPSFSISMSVIIRSTFFNIRALNFYSYLYTGKRSSIMNLASRCSRKWFLLKFIEQIFKLIIKLLFRDSLHFHFPKLQNVPPHFEVFQVRR